MDSYQALARRYRPKRLSEVIGQEAVVTTLSNALRRGCLSHAYLFSGPRGTGKTSLARILAKILNCTRRGESQDPCDACNSCREIAQGTSLDVLEIDAASHRGIEEMRRLSEGVGYAAANGRYKIYIIDEVHMLTKEAFNALLKTLEEPPANVKFFLATTEPHRIPATILSRCQRFELMRLKEELIVQKLRGEAKDLGVSIDNEALFLIAKAAQGGMRDAESILDQMVSFHGEIIDGAVVRELLAIAPKELFFRLDAAVHQGHLLAAFEIAQELFSRGGDPLVFIEGLIEHFRCYLLLNLNVAEAAAAPLLSQEEISRYRASTAIYTKELCLTLLDDLIAAQESLKTAPSKELALEVILMRIIRSPQRIPLELLVRRLTELEERVRGSIKESEELRPAEAVSPPRKAQEREVSCALEVVADPPQEVERIKPNLEVMPIKPQSRYDTLVRFAAVELEGKLESPRR